MKKLKNAFAKHVNESTSHQVAAKDEPKRFKYEDNTWYEIARDSWALKPSVKSIDFAAKFGRRL